MTLRTRLFKTNVRPKSGLYLLECRRDRERVNAHRPLTQPVRVTERRAGVKPTPNPHRRPRRPLVIPGRVAARAASKFEADGSGCWISTYSTASHGYAQIGWHEDDGYRRGVTAHRAAWVYHHGQQIPEGMTIDHTCKTKPCVNPSHLRMLSNFENARRTAGRDWPLGECVNGHSNDHLIQKAGKWRCGPCSQAEQSRYYAKKRAEAHPVQQHLLGKKGER